MTENQIDHVVINKTWRSSLQDTRGKRSADAGLDHHLVVAEVNMKLWALKKVRTIRTKYCTYKLKDQRVKDEFTITLADRYDALYNGSDDDEEMEPELEEEWSQIKEMYSSTCEEVLGKVTRERKEWMSEDTWEIVEERRKLKAKMEAAKTRNQKLATTHAYNMKNTEVKRSCRRDKRKRINDIARETQEAAEKQDMKKVYGTTRLFSGKRNVQTTPVKDKNGEVLTRTDDQLKRWKEHFQ